MMVTGCGSNDSDPPPQDCVSFWVQVKTAHEKGRCVMQKCRTSTFVVQELSYKQECERIWKLSCPVKTCQSATHHPSLPNGSLGLCCEKSPLGFPWRADIQASSEEGFADPREGQTPVVLVDSPSTAAEGHSGPT